MNIGSIVLKAGGSRVLPTYMKKLPGSRKRLMAKCLLCNEFNDVSVQNSGRKKVPIANGIRCDSKEKLQYIVDDLLGPAHQAVFQHKNLLT